MIVMTVEMRDKDTRRMSIEELEQMREEIPVVTVEMIDEDTRERITGVLELMRK